MKISVIGSVKIDSRWRRKLFLYNLDSFDIVSEILYWRVNIVGKYADFVKEEILKRYKNAVVTTDDDSSYYEVTKNQLQGSQYDIVLFWEEDNWFLCSSKYIFLYLLSEFEKSSAEVLTISHLITSWKTKKLLPVTGKENYLYGEYKVDKESQKKVWEKYSEAYLTGISAIYKKQLALEALEFTKPYIKDQKSARQFELSREKGEKFLEKRSFIEMIPTVQVIREVFRFHTVDRIISFRKAKQVLKLRDKGYL